MSFTVAKPVKTPADLSYQRHLVFTLVLILVGFSLSYLLPRVPPRKESAISLDLPLSFGEWTGMRKPDERNTPSQAERDALADDTEYCKDEYTLKGPLSFTRRLLPIHDLSASIVLSGKDLNESVHRLERCLMAQGFRNLELRPTPIDVDGRKMMAMRVSSTRDLTNPTTGKPIMLKNGLRAFARSIHYYWFVGNHAITHDHYRRTLIDMKDRIFGGYDQRWAYLLVTATASDDLIAGEMFESDPVYPEGRSVEQTDTLLQDAIKAIARHSIKWDEIK
jgi:hypothetical protein